MRYEIKELTLGGILDQGINLFKDHFVTLITISLYLAIPFGFIQYFCLNSLSVPLNSNPYVFGDNSNELGGSVFIGIVVFSLIQLILVYPVTQAATIYALSGAYLDKPITSGAAMRFAFGKIVALALTGLLSGIFIILGTIALIIPGIYLALRFSLISYVVVIENISGMAALKRSGELMRGYYGRAIVLGVVLAVISWLVNSMTSALPTIYASSIATILIGALTVILVASIGVVLYFSTRCTHENFDLTILAQAVSDSPQE